MCRWLAVSILVLLVAVGCGQPSTTPSSEPSTQAAKPAAENQTDQGAKRYRIAVIPKGLVHQFWLTVKAGAEAAGAELGADIIWKGPEKETDIPKQINIVEDMISAKVDAIVMAACDKKALVSRIEEAVRAGIPVVTIDSGVDSDLPISFVATDNVAGARKAAETLAKLIGEEGKVGLLPFVLGAATSDMREQGFKEGLQQFPKIQLVATRYSESDVAKGMSAVEDMLTANPDLKGIFAANESGAMGAVQALEATGSAGKVKLVAFDAAEREIEALKAGTIQALIVQNPFRMGYDGVKAAIDHIQGRPVEKRIDTGVTVVTAENLNDPDVQKLLYPTTAPAQ